MPTLRRTPFNLGGSYVADPFDAAEEGNRNAAMHANEFNYGAQQNNALTALALARLKQQDYQFGQGRADSMAMFREGLAAQNHNTDVNAQLARDTMAGNRGMWEEQFQYGKDRAASEDTWRKTLYDDSMNPERNPALKNQQMTLTALQKLLDRQDRMDTRADKNMDRADAAANNVQTPVFRDDYERQTYNANIAAGMTPAQAALAITKDRRDKGAMTAEQLKGQYGRSIDQATSGSMPFIRTFVNDFGDQTGKDSNAALETRTKLVAAMKDSGMDDAAIAAALRDIETSHKPGLFPTDEAQALYARLGY